MKMIYSCMIVASAIANWTTDMAMNIFNTIMEALQWDDKIVRGIYGLGINVWNCTSSFVCAFVQSPINTGDRTQAAFNTVIGIFDNANLKSLGMTLLIIFFLYDLIEKICRNQENITPLMCFFTVVRLIIASTIFDNLKNIITALMTFGGELAAIFKSPFPVDNVGLQDLSGDINVGLEAGQFLIGTLIIMIFSIIFLVVMVSSSINLVKEVFALYEDLFFALPFAPLAMGTMTNQGQWGHVAVGYFKTLICKVVAIAAIILALNITAMLCDSLVGAIVAAIEVFPVTDVPLLRPVMVMLPQIFRAMLMVGGVRAIDSRIAKFGL